MEEEEIISELKKKVEEADNDARSLSADNSIIGRVTRYETVRIGERNYIGIDIGFEDYMRSNIKMDEYLGIRTIVHPALIIGRVISISRSDMLATLRIREISSYPKDPATIMTDTFIEIEPIAEKDLVKGVIRPAVSPIDPQSPVIRPKSEVLEEILGIPKEGITIGRIYSGGEVLEDTEVKFDEEILRHHVLIIGTTGSGKTTLLKTITSSNVKVFVFDRQGDFVRHAINKIDEFVVIMPVTKRMIEDVPSKFLPLQYGEKFAERYGCKFPTEYDVKQDEILMECRGKVIHLIPYSIRFGEVFPTLYKIAPYMSETATLEWDAIAQVFSSMLKNSLEEKLKGYVNDVREIISKVMENIEPENLIFKELKIEHNFEIKGTKTTDVIKISNNLLTVYINEIFTKTLEELKLFPQTKNSIMRVIKAFAESGIFNVSKTFHFSEDFFKYNKIIVDLTWVLDYSASVQAMATIAYKLLSDFYNWKDKLYKEGKVSELTLLIMDEAHEYFPQTAKVEASKEIVEGLVNRLMRLGRVRNIGVILATHVPDDLNELIIQLTNTKIIMRNDISILKKLGFEDYADILQIAPAGVAVIRSTKFSDVLIRTLPGS